MSQKEHIPAASKMMLNQPADCSHSRSLTGSHRWDVCCGERMKTTSTVQRDDHTLRYKKCLKCGETLHSEERWKRPEKPKPNIKRRGKLRLKLSANTIL